MSFRPWYLLVFGVVGCAGGLEQHPVAKVSGQITCNGEPVPFVQVVFVPKRAADAKGVETGKGGYAVADVEGKFVLSTYGDGDGAIVGKHAVSIQPPNPEDFPTFSCECAVAEIKYVKEVDVVSGQENVIDVALPEKPAGSKGKPAMSADDLEDAMEARGLEVKDEK